MSSSLIARLLEREKLLFSESFSHFFYNITSTGNKAHNLPSEEAQGALIYARTEADSIGCLVNDLLTLARFDEMAQALTTLVRVNNTKYFSFDDRKPNHHLYVRNSRCSLLLT